MIIDYMKVLYKLTSKKEQLTRKEEDKMIKLIKWCKNHNELINQELNK